MDNSNEHDSETPDEVESVHGPRPEDVEHAKSGGPVKRPSTAARVIGAAMVGVGFVHEPQKYERDHVVAQAPDEDVDSDDGELFKRISFGGDLDALW